MSVVDLDHIAVKHKLSLKRTGIIGDLKTGPSEEVLEAAKVSKAQPAPQALAHVASKEEEAQGWGLF